MEVIAVASTICAICKGIEAFIDQHAEKEAMMIQISSIVAQIRNILSPFANAEFKGTGQVELVNSIRAVGDVLQRTKEHLMVWKYKRSQKIVAFLNPAALIKQLKDDEKQLNNQLIILLTALAVVGYFRESKSSSQVAQKPPTASQQLSDNVALEFWQDYIGAKIQYASKDTFCERLNMWADGALSQFALDRIVMRLDEYDSGGISLSTLSRVLEETSLNDFIRQSSRGEKPPPYDQAIIKTSTAPGQQLRTPLLVWIDDSPQNNAYEAAEATAKGIMVIQLTSTAVAKAWVDANSAFLRENDHPSRLRFISDNVRLESTPGIGSYLNPTAGESFLRYLRGRCFEAPVLIYTGFSIDSTRYVNSFTKAGSTVTPNMCLKYIMNLAAGQEDDSEWVGFKNF